MTREEEIKDLEVIKDFFAENSDAIPISIEYAIKALEQEPICPSHGIDCEDCPAYDPCGDAISRQAVLDLMQMKMGGKELYMAVYDLPSVNPQPKTGHWIECEDEVKCFCSECKEISDYPTKFCPNCGLKMVEPQEIEET